MDNDEDIIAITLIVQVCALICLFWGARRGRRTGLRRWGIHPMNQRRNAIGVFNTSYDELRLYPDRFHNYTRFTVDQFDRLLGLVRDKLVRRKTANTIPPEMRLLLTLRFLATGDSPTSFSTHFRCGKSTFLEIVQDTCEAIYESLARDYVNFPTKAKFIDIAESFYRRWQFPLCLGCIDGKHVKIQAPPNSGSNNFNYLKTFSLVLLAVCDADYKFTFFDVGTEGSNSDSGILRKTEFGKRLYGNGLDLPNPTNLPNTSPDSKRFSFCFLGDEAFALGMNMMRPYPKPATVNNHLKRVFNYRLCRARRIIENSFGILAARFRFLHGTIQASEENVVKYMSAAIALHNFLMTDSSTRFSAQNANYTPDVIGPNGEIIVEGGWRRIASGTFEDRQRNFNRNCTRSAKEQRNLMAEYFSSPEGLVNWQDQRVAQGTY